MPTYSPNGTINFSVSDIRDAGVDGVISPDDAERLIAWLSNQQPEEAPAVETAKGFNLVTVAYYFGAMLMISACAWFLGNSWQSLGSRGILIVTTLYFGLAAWIGWRLRGKGYVVGGGLLITVAVCLTPLIVYCIEDLTGFWPAENPGAYEDYYPMVRGGWIVMELVTMAVALAALLKVRFGFLLAPFAFSLWFLSMDLAAWFLGSAYLDRNTMAWMAVLVGVIGLGFGYAFDKALTWPDRSEDFGFWCYLFGLMAFWGGLTSMDSDSEIGRLIYCGINIGLIALSLYLRRSMFLVFGALGIFIYLGHLAYEVFEDSVFFPFALIFLGLAMIVATVLAQKYLKPQTKKPERF